MGKTWFILIENSLYNDLRELDGPAKDALIIQDAIANYDIDSVLHKKNFSLAELKKFFEYELKEVLTKNNVKSVVIWYSGHGKYSERYLTGYWIPVDATSNNFDSFFFLTELKVYLSNYKKIKHILLISDACETGQAFYTTKISTSNATDCADWQSTKFKSSECFTSSDKERSSDNSIFAKTFANFLKNNPDPCISIGGIVKKVVGVVESNQQQVPVFGRISGLEEENGTFFFVRRK